MAGELGQPTPVLTNTCPSAEDTLQPKVLALSLSCPNTPEGYQAHQLTLGERPLREHLPEYRERALISTHPPILLHILSFTDFNGAVVTFTSSLPSWNQCYQQTNQCFMQSIASTRHCQEGVGHHFQTRRPLGKLHVRS